MDSVTEQLTTAISYISHHSSCGGSARSIASLLSPTRSPRRCSGRFQTASAFDLPCEDNSFDLVLTSAALEQMHANYPKALSEIRRIARRYALFLEPFADFNRANGRLILWSKNYFRIRSGELRKHGFRPIGAWRNFPVTPTFAFGLVLAEVV